MLLSLLLAQLPIDSVTAIGAQSGGAGSVVPGIEQGDAFGSACVSVGDLNGDGVEELAVGSEQEDEGGNDFGVVRILFRDAEGVLTAVQTIGSGLGGFTGVLRTNDKFGSALACLGDLDGDGRPELAVGAHGDSEPGVTNGAVWILSLNPDGSVHAHAKINEQQGAFGGELQPFEWFGAALTELGDLDGDGNTDLAVGAPRDTSGGFDAGSVWILFLNAFGQVKSEVELRPGSPGLESLVDTTLFGHALSYLGDLDGDGAPELAVGAPRDDDGGTNKGAVWILSLDATGSVLGTAKISDTQGGFGGELFDVDDFGYSLARLPDLDGDAVPELAVGHRKSDVGGLDSGALWILRLAADGSVKSHESLDALLPTFGGALQAGDHFGWSVAVLDDLDQNGRADVCVGAPGDDNGLFAVDDEQGGGAAWVVSLDAGGDVDSAKRYGGVDSGFSTEIVDFDRFGTSVVGVPDLDGDGVPDALVGVPGADQAGPDSGSLWTLFLRADGRVHDQARINALSGPGSPTAFAGDRLGDALAYLGDLDGDGTPEVGAGTPFDDDGGFHRGAFWILSLGPDGLATSSQKISQFFGGFAGSLEDSDHFGWDLCPLGDLDQDGTLEVAVGAPGTDDPNLAGAVWIVSLDASLQCVGAHPLTVDGLDSADEFGTAVAAPGDLNYDGVPDLLVGAPGDDDGGANTGAIYLLLLDAAGQPLATHKFAGDHALLTELEGFDRLGSALDWMGDLDGDGFGELLAGAPGDGAGFGFEVGATYVLHFAPGVPWGAAPLLIGADKLGGSSSVYDFELENGEEFGRSLARLGDLDGDDAPELLIGLPGANEGGLDRGALRVVFPTAVPTGPGYPFGCGVNPAGSMSLPFGQPIPGGDVELWITNPLGNQNPGTQVYVALAFEPTKNAPCGLLVPGWGMQAGVGELLLDVPSLFSIQVAQPWTGFPTIHPVSIPNDPQVQGARFFAQAFLLDGSQPASPFGVGLTEAIEILVE